MFELLNAVEIADAIVRKEERFNRIESKWKFVDLSNGLLDDGDLYLIEELRELQQSTRKLRGIRQQI